METFLRYSMKHRTVICPYMSGNSDRAHKAWLHFDIFGLSTETPNKHSLPLSLGIGSNTYSDVQQVLTITCYCDPHSI